MTSRERWILYPLLFLTLGIAMRGTVWRQGRFDAGEIAADDIAAYREITAGKIHCRQLVVTGPEGNEGVRMGMVPDRGGWLELCGKSGKKIVAAGADETGQSGVVETLNSEEVPQVQLWSNESGGVVRAVGPDKTTWLLMGYSGENYGVFVESSRLGRRMLLTLPWRFDTPTPPGREPKERPSGREPPGDPADGTGHCPGGRTIGAEKGGLASQVLFW